MLKATFTEMEILFLDQVSTVLAWLACLCNQKQSAVVIFHPGTKLVMPLIFMDFAQSTAGLSASL